MGQALYRKYRSASLDEVVGQEHITQTLGNAIASGRINHAYLFTGPRGVGKTSIARILAHQINKLPYDGTEHVDIIEIDAASNNGVEDIRDLREKVRLAPASAEYKVYIIDEVHMLSTAAFNALLKTLEEPPKHAVFILATTEAHKLPATIVSRSQRFGFRPVALPAVAKHLQFIAKKEGISIDNDALKIVAEHGEGSFRDSISLLDQLANLGSKKVTTADVEQLLGMAPQKMVHDLLQLLLAGDAQNALQLLSNEFNRGVSVTTLNKQLIAEARKTAIDTPALYGLIAQLIEVPKSFDPRVKFEVVAMQFAFAVSQPQALHAAPPKVSSGTPAPVTPPKKSATAPKPVGPRQASAVVPAPVVEIEQPPTPAEAPVVTTPAEDTDFYMDDLPEKAWKGIVAATKDKSTTLYTIIRQAVMHFDAEKQLLTLTFRFPLHQRRFEEQKYKSVFTNVLSEVIGGVPAVQVVVNKDVAKKDKPRIEEIATLPSDTVVAPAAIADESTSAVLAMMGGEVVNA